MLSPKQCPKCNEANKVDACFCENAKCGMPLTLDASAELAGELKKRQDALDDKIQEKVDLVREQIIQQVTVKFTSLFGNMVNSSQNGDSLRDMCIKLE
jgi:hypothetical protein